MDVLQKLSHIRTLCRDTFSGEVYAFDEWFKDEQRHREQGPASVVRDVAAGVIVREAWWRDGKLHRARGPAITQRAAATGMVIRESWWRSGKRHRPDGPAVILRDAATGATLREEWWRQGAQLCRPGEPEDRVAIGAHPSLPAP